MQNAGIQALGLNWRYLAFDVHPDHLSNAIAGAKAMNFIGLNLTVPHKMLALTMVDTLDESARKWGAVNTILFEGRESTGTWQPLRSWTAPPAEVRSHGFNTDAEAIVEAVRQDLGVTVTGARVLLLGAGGAGRTAALRLASEGVSELFLINRTASKAQAVAEEIRRHWPKIRTTLDYPSEAIDLVLNATSLGLKPEDPLPFDQSRFSLGQASAVYDMIYRPAQTLLLERARTSGCRTANGLSMLLYQGAKALEIWTGEKAPSDIMRQALHQNVYGR